MEVNLPTFSDDDSLVHCPVSMKEVWITPVGDKVVLSLSNLEISGSDSCVKYFYGILKSLR